jgi:ABC-type polysaccharide/polyol phosphate export permease
LKVGGAGNAPYVVWFLPGMAMWMTISDGVLSASSSIRTYSYLVKKVIFPVDIIPVISIISGAFVAIFLFAISIVVCSIYGCIPNMLILIYAIVAMYALIIAITRLTSALTTLVPDFSQLLGIVMQLFFWFTPIVWNLSMLAEHPLIQKLMLCTPFTYLVTTIRSAFFNEGAFGENFLLYTAVFWVITILLFVWGNHVFRKNKKDFADVL